MANIEQLKGAKADLVELIDRTKAHAVLIRLGWHDAGNFDKNITAPWPAAGGATGSIRFAKELGHGANAGLAKIVALLQPIKDKYPEVSYADLFQLASATAVELAGGPKIPLKLGRLDAPSEDDVPPEGRLPAGGAPYPNGADGPGKHLRDVFYRLGFSDQEIVALSGAHTLGRAYKDRSGYGKDSTPYTKDPVAPGATVGGSSWTKDWLKFDNSYFKDVKAKADENLLVLETDAALFEDPGFKPYAEKYAEDQDAFFADYALAHAKLSERGAKFANDAPVTL